MGSILNCLVNAPVFRASARGDFERFFYCNSIQFCIVKENYKPDRKTLDSVTLMYKYYGYNPEGGDWFWGKYGPDGKVIKAGKVDSCIQCHQAATFKDYLFTEPAAMSWNPSPPVGVAPAPGVGSVGGVGGM